MKRALFFIFGLTVASALAATPTSSDKTPAKTTDKSPPFTKQQATQGASTYKASCAMCHGTKLDNGGAPHLAGDVFLKKWGKNTLDDFHYIMSTTMPQTNPGGLKPEQYLNLVTYVLQQNGFKPGEKALKADDLKKYTFQMDTKKTDSKADTKK